MAVLIFFSLLFFSLQVSPAHAVTDQVSWQSVQSLYVYIIIYIFSLSVFYLDIFIMILTDLTLAVHSHSKCDGRGGAVRVCELRWCVGLRGGDPSFDVLRRGGLP